MEFKIYRDLASIAFVRCVSPIPGTEIWAEGTSFFVGRAIEKCRSEVIESQFQLAHPNRDKILGIAAHPSSTASEENAWNEAIEVLVLKNLGADPVFQGLSFSFAGIRLLIGRVNDRYVSLALFTHNGEETATQAVSKNPFKTALKAWTEVRNLRLYNPTVHDLPKYTKANRLLTGMQLKQISARPGTFNSVDTRRLRKFQSTEETHVITYFTQEAS